MWSFTTTVTAAAITMQLYALPCIQLPSVNTRGVAHRLKPLGAVLAVGVVPVIEMQLLAVADVAESNQHNSFDRCMPRLHATWLLLLLRRRLLLLLRRTFMIWVCVDVGQVAAQLAAALACASRIRGQQTGWNTFSGSMLWCLRELGPWAWGGWGGGCRPEVSSMQHRATLGITGCGGWLMRWPTFMPTLCAARQAARGESVKESGGQQRTWRCSSGSGVTQPKSDQVECGTAAAQAQGSCAHMQRGLGF